MLSVLIPTYNYNAFPLVKEIHSQLIILKIDFEIICIDDGSNFEENYKNNDISKLESSSFEILKNNIGRSAIRNLLATKAKYDWLLYLDADVMPKNEDFISNYLNFVKDDNSIFCGGLLYENKWEHKRLLRYKYGKKFEEVSLEKRINNSEKYFFTSNFLIPKKIFETVVFEEKLKVYGREDLLFSMNLNKNNFKIKHIENQVIHLGIDSNQIFVAKTKKAMENLSLMKNENLIDNTEVTLLNVVTKLSKFRIHKRLGKTYPLFEKLTISLSSVFFFNCLKVTYLCHLRSAYE